MRTTPNYGWPYPELADPPDGPGQIGSLANAVDTTLKAQIAAASVAFTPTWTGLTLGNATSLMTYRRLGGHIAVYLEIRAAASAPTTVFSGFCSFTTPFTAAQRAAGAMYFESASGLVRPGMLGSVGGNSAITVWSIRQSDLNLTSPSAVWGTGAWTTSDRMFGSILIPI